MPERTKLPGCLASPRYPAAIRVLGLTPMREAYSVHGMFGIYERRVRLSLRLGNDIQG